MVIFSHFVQVPETKNRSLAEIEEHFTNSKGFRWVQGAGEEDNSPLQSLGKKKTVNALAKNMTFISTSEEDVSQSTH